MVITTAILQIEWLNCVSYFNPNGIARKTFHIASIPNNRTNSFLNSSFLPCFIHRRRSQSALQRFMQMRITLWVGAEYSLSRWRWWKQCIISSSCPDLVCKCHSNVTLRHKLRFYWKDQLYNERYPWKASIDIFPRFNRINNVIQIEYAFCWWMAIELEHVNDCLSINRRSSVYFRACWGARKFSNVPVKLSMSVVSKPLILPDSSIFWIYSHPWQNWGTPTFQSTSLITLVPFQNSYVFTGVARSSLLP